MLVIVLNAILFMFVLSFMDIASRICNRFFIIVFIYD